MASLASFCSTHLLQVYFVGLGNSMEGRGVEARAPGTSTRHLDGRWIRPRLSPIFIATNDGLLLKLLILSDKKQ